MTVKYVLNGRSLEREFFGKKAEAECLKFLTALKKEYYSNPYFFNVAKMQRYDKDARWGNDKKKWNALNEEREKFLKACPLVLVKPSLKVEIVNNSFESLKMAA